MLRPTQQHEGEITAAGKYPPCHTMAPGTYKLRPMTWAFYFSQNGKVRTASTSIPSIDFFLGTNSFGLGKGKGDGFLVFSSSCSWAQLETKNSTNNGLYVSSMELPLMGFLDGVATKSVASFHKILMCSEGSPWFLQKLIYRSHLKSLYHLNQELGLYPILCRLYTNPKISKNGWHSQIKWWILCSFFGPPSRKVFGKSSISKF